MTINNKQLLTVLDELLLPGQVHDYCPNGLQVEGRPHIQRLVTGVTASLALLEQAVEKKADGILVHHGYFWKGENSAITGIKKKRLQLLLQHDINLYAYHLPLDIHPKLGNNARLAAMLGIQDLKPLDTTAKPSIAMQGHLSDSVDQADFIQLITRQLDREPLFIAGGSHSIRTVALCTGGGQGYIDLAAEQGIDAFISGEASEKTVHTAREAGIHFFAAGHHATERYGAKAVGEYLASTLHLDVEFIDIDNPV